MWSVKLQMKIAPIFRKQIKKSRLPNVKVKIVEIPLVKVQIRDGINADNVRL